MAKAAQPAPADEAPAAQRRKEPPSQTGVIIGSLAKSAAHAIGSQIGRQIVRGILGSLFGARRR
jgi:hypothetical protein